MNGTGFDENPPTRDCRNAHRILQGRRHDGLGWRCILSNKPTGQFTGNSSQVSLKANVVTRLAPPSPQENVLPRPDDGERSGAHVAFYSR